MPESNSAAQNITVTTGNEISENGKIVAGILFVAFTLLAIIYLIAFWPDRLPKADNAAIYTFRLFNISLLDNSSFNTTATLTKSDSAKINSITKQFLDSADKRNPGTLDSSQMVSRTADSARTSDSVYKAQSLSRKQSAVTGTITLNTLLLLLVAIAGFLGTMIHIASSFTNYIGAEKFKKSWLLWYIVKPFTGAGLALIFYFVFRAGLLNFNDTSNINLYGIITMAAFAGLFTDKATMKLAEIFAVIFKTGDDKGDSATERPDKINSDQVNMKITGIKPESLLMNSENQLIISGTGFDQKKLIVKMDDDEIMNPVITSDSISLTYSIPSDSDKKEFTLRVLDEKGNEIYSNVLSKQDEVNLSPDPPTKSSDTGNKLSSQAGGGNDQGTESEKI